MGYVRISNRAVARYGRGRGVARTALSSDMWDYAKREMAAADNEEQLRCLNQANESAAVRAIDAQIASLASTWHPTGVYTGADITKMMNMLADATSRARAVLVGLPPDAYGITNARSYLDTNEARINAYRAAVAKSGGLKIPAPDLKKEVLKSLVNVSNAYVTADVIQCRLTWGQQALALINRAVDVAKSIIGTVLDFAEKAADAIKAPFSIIGWLGKYPYVPVGIAAVILYKKYAHG